MSLRKWFADFLSKSSFKARDFALLHSMREMWMHNRNQLFDELAAHRDAFSKWADIRDVDEQIDFFQKSPWVWFEIVDTILGPSQQEELLYEMLTLSNKLMRFESRIPSCQNLINHVQGEVPALIEWRCGRVPVPSAAAPFLEVCEIFLSMLANLNSSEANYPIRQIVTLGESGCALQWDDGAVYEITYGAADGLIAMGDGKEFECAPSTMNKLLNAAPCLGRLGDTILALTPRIGSLQQKFHAPTLGRIKDARKQRANKRR